MTSAGCANAEGRAMNPPDVRIKTILKSSDFKETAPVYKHRIHCFIASLEMLRSKNASVQPFRVLEQKK